MNFKIINGDCELLNICFYLAVSVLISLRGISDGLMPRQLNQFSMLGLNMTPLFAEIYSWVLFLKSAVELNYSVLITLIYAVLIYQMGVKMRGAKEKVHEFIIIAVGFA